MRLIYLVIAIILAINIMMIFYMYKCGVFDEYIPGVYLVLAWLPCLLILVALYSLYDGNPKYAIIFGLMAMMFPALGCWSAYNNQVE